MQRAQPVKRAPSAAAYHRARCVSTSSPGPPSRSGSTSCGRSPSGSSGSGSPGFGWGAAWLAGDGRLGVVPRHPGLPRRPRPRGGRGDRDDGRPGPPPPAVAAVDADARRTPSRSTTRPAASRSATTATCATTGRCARRTAAEGRIHGRADTEVGERWLEDAWHAGRAGRPPPRRAARPVRRPGQPRRARRRRRRRTTTPATARTRSSRSASDGSGSSRPGSTRSTGRSSGSSAPGATDRRLVPLRTTVSLDRDGTDSARRRMARRPAVAPSRPTQDGSFTDQPSEPSDDRVPAATRRPTATAARRRRFPIGELVRISLYWLGLSSIFAGLSTIMAGRLEFTGLVDQAEARPSAVPRLDQSARSSPCIVQPTVGSISRLHDHALGPSQAVHLHRLAARPRVPRRDRDAQHARRDRRLRRPAPVQLELRPGPVPGLRAGPRARPRRSGIGERARRADAGPRRRVGLRCIGALATRIARLRDRAHRRSASSSSSTMLSRVIRVREGRPPKSREGRSVAVDRAPRRGARTSCASTASCGWSRRGSLILMGGSRPDHLAVFYLARTMRPRRADDRAIVSSRSSRSSPSGRSSSVVPGGPASRTGSGASRSSGRAALIGADRAGDRRHRAEPADRLPRRAPVRRRRPGSSWPSTGR